MGERGGPAGEAVGGGRLGRLALVSSEGGSRGVGRVNVGNPEPGERGVVMWVPNLIRRMQHA